MARTRSVTIPLHHLGDYLNSNLSLTLCWYGSYVGHTNWLDFADFSKEKRHRTVPSKIYLLALEMILCELENPWIFLLAHAIVVALKEQSTWQYLTSAKYSGFAFSLSPRNNPLCWISRKTRSVFQTIPRLTLYEEIKMYGAVLYWPVFVFTSLCSVS